MSAPRAIAAVVAPANPNFLNSAAADVISLCRISSVVLRGAAVDLLRDRSLLVVRLFANLTFTENVKPVLVVLR